jgi:hypothetical protein
MSTGNRTTNLRLAALLRESGYSNKAFGRVVRSTSERVGWPVTCDHVNVARWLRGQQPRPETADLILMVLSQKLGRRVSGADAGIRAAGVLPSVPDVVVATAVERDLEVMRRRLDWLTAEAAHLARALDAVRDGKAAPEPVRARPAAQATVYRRATHRAAAHAAFRAGAAVAG